MTIGSRIKELRERRGLSQTDLGKLLYPTRKESASQNKLSRLETDAQEPKFNDLVRLVEVFGIDAYYIITGKQPQAAPSDEWKDKYISALEEIKKLQEEIRKLHSERQPYDGNDRRAPHLDA